MEKGSDMLRTSTSISYPRYSGTLSKHFFECFPGRTFRGYVFSDGVQDGGDAISHVIGDVLDGLDGLVRRRRHLRGGL